MQKFVIGMVLGSVLSLPLLAQAEGSYVKFGLGRSDYGDGGEFSKPTGWSLAYGMNVQKNLDLEAGYMDFGKWGVSESAGPASASLSQRARALYLAGVQHLPVADNVSVYGKLGAAMVSVKERGTGDLSLLDALDIVGAPSNGTKTLLRPVLGAGLNVQFNKELSGHLEYTHVSYPGTSDKLSRWQMGLGYHF